MRKSNYSQEFRESTIKFCIDNSDRSISSIARDLGLNKGTLTLWVNDYKVVLYLSFKVNRQNKKNH